MRNNRTGACGAFVKITLACGCVRLGTSTDKRVVMQLPIHVLCEAPDHTHVRAFQNL